MVPAGRLWRRRPAASAPKVRLVASRWCTARPAARSSALKKNLWAPAEVGRDFDLSPTSLAPLEPFRELPDDRQQHRRAQRRGVHAAGDRRRPLPLERGVPDAVASEADRGLRRPRRHLARSDLRAAVRPGHADSVDAAVHRERRPGGRLRLRLLLRLHRHDQLGVADAAAADDPRPARRVRSAVRRRRDAGGARARTAAPTAASSTGSPTQVGAAAQGARRRRPRAARRVPGRRPRDRAPHPEGRGAQQQRRAARAARRADRRARLVRRARQADVRPAGAGASRPTSRASSRSSWAATRRAASIRRAASPPAFHTASHHGEREDGSSSSRRSTGTTSAWCRTSSRS